MSNLGKEIIVDMAERIRLHVSRWGRCNASRPVVDEERIQQAKQGPGRGKGRGRKGGKGRKIVLHRLKKFLMDRRSYLQRNSQ